jgi:hypothetical protein
MRACVLPGDDAGSLDPDSSSVILDTIIQSLTPTQAHELVSRGGIEIIDVVAV